MLKTPDFRQSRDTQIVYDLLRDIASRAPPVITWGELTEATGKHRQQLRGPVATALRNCLNNDGLVIENDRGIGYRLRSDREHSICGRHASDRSRRILRTGLKKMNCTDVARLSVEERMEHNIRKSVLELALMPSRPRTITNVSQMVMRKHNELDEQEMLNAIREALSGKK